jgi:ATP-dependent helicase Lhr and Lhr-like helicase
MISRDRDDVRWWTWAGFRANATLAETLSDLTDGLRRFTDTHLRMRADLTPEMWKAATTDAAERPCIPEIDHDALTGLKFSEALPECLATATLAARLADTDAAATIVGQPGPVGGVSDQMMTVSRAEPSPRPLAQCPLPSNVSHREPG